MFFLRLVFALLLVRSSSELAFAEGGSGGSSVRGGTGVRCGSALNVQPLEDYLASGKVEPIEDIDVFALVGRLPKEPEFQTLAAQMIETSNQIGPVDQWPYSIEINSNRKTHDEGQDFTLPFNCELVQLATMGRGTDEPKMPTRFMDSGWLSKRGKSILRFHEALYKVADEKYGHRNSLAIRGLIAALLSDSNDADIRGLAENLIHYREGLNVILKRVPILADFADDAAIYFAPKTPSQNCPVFGLSYSGDGDLIRCDLSTSMLLQLKCQTYSIDQWIDWHEADQSCQYRQTKIDRNIYYPR